MKQPKKTAYKTEWDLKQIYKSDTDPQIEKDLVTTEKAYAAFEKKWKKNETYLSDLSVLRKALKEYEALFALEVVSRPYVYMTFRTHIDSSNKKAQAELPRIGSRLTEAQNRVLFFELRLGKIAKDMQKKILADASFREYAYFLEQIWKRARYDLSESEEQIINLMQEPASSMWKRGFDKLLSSQKVLHKGKELTVDEAVSNSFQLPTEERKELHAKMNAALIGVSDFAEAEINAIYTRKKIEDKLRGYKNPYDQTLLRYQNDEKTVFALVDAVTRNFKISHKFYALKAKILKMKKLDYPARSISIGAVSRSFTFDKACEIVSSAFEKVDPKYKDIFEDFLKEGRIDVYPKVGKTGGAYCMSDISIPTFVLHNYTDSFKSVNTLAHEMGHAFHSHMSKTQKPLYQDYTMSVAETASTLFENFVFDELFESLSDDEKIIALHDKINSSIATVFRQIACFNFERDLHALIREKGFASKEEMAILMNKHMKAYLGPVFELTPEDGYYFVNWSHIRRFFYVYSYAYGELVSSALYAKYKQDKSFMKKIEEFLSAGGSKSPYQIFKDIGIDTTKPDFFENGLKEIEKEIAVLEKLVNKKK